MTESVKALDVQSVAELVDSAFGKSQTIEIIGHGSKRAIGRPLETDLILDISELRGIALYEPNELVLSAKAGTPVAEIDKLLDDHEQELAFEPIDYGLLLGGTAANSTIGGVVACNLSGPRRIKAGAARDHLLGARAVSGRGEIFKAGGRVIKNVTGYDLCKLLAGSWGTLAVITEVTVRVVPKPEDEETLVVHGLDDATAAKVMATAMGSTVDVSSAAHIPARLASRLPNAVSATGAITALRLEGVAPSMVPRGNLLKTVLGSHGPISVLHKPDSRTLWRRLRNVAPFADGPAGGRVVWRVSTAPMDGHKVVAQIAAEMDAEAFYDWAGGLVWIAVPPSNDGGAACVRRAVAAIGGHATLIRAPASLRSAVDVFEPQVEALATVTKRLKMSFDPKSILNPGRMYACV